MSKDLPGRYTLHARRMGTVHIVRYWEVCRDGESLDVYEDREMAAAYVAYMNAREAKS